MEVVVNVDAGWTTTSEQSQFGVVTSSKGNLITSETETTPHIQEVVVADLR